MSRIRQALLTVLMVCGLASSPLQATAVMVDPNNARGWQPGKLISHGDLGTINTFNGNLIVRIPIGQTYSARPGFEYQLTLTYNSKVWDYEFLDYNAADGLPHYKRVAVPEGDSNAGLGWILSLGRIIPARPGDPVIPGTGPIYLAPDGSRHEFWATLRGDTKVPFDRVKPYTVYTNDGSYLRAMFTDSLTTIDFPNGQRHTFDTLGRLRQIDDPYGNWVKVDPMFDAAGVERWIITDGYGTVTARTHTVQFERAPEGLYSSSRVNFRQRVKTVSLAAFPQDLSNSTAVYTFEYNDTNGLPADDTIQNGSCAAYIPEIQPGTIRVPMLTRIVLPDASAFVPDYYFTEVSSCSSGALKQLTLPTGGRVSWVYGAYKLSSELCSVQPSVGETGRWTWAYENSGVTDRTVTSGTNSATWHYRPELTEGAVRRSAVTTLSSIRTSPDHRRCSRTPSSNRAERRRSITFPRSEPPKRCLPISLRSVASTACLSRG